MIAVGVGDAGQTVAVELVGGLGDGGGPGGQGLGVDGVAVLDVQVDQGAGGRVLGRQGVGEHQHSAADLDLGMADASLGHGDAEPLDGPEGVDEEVDESGGVIDDQVGRDGGVAIGDGFDVGHGGSCGYGASCAGECGDGIAVRSHAQEGLKRRVRRARREHGGSGHALTPLARAAGWTDAQGAGLKPAPAV